MARNIATESNITIEIRGYNRVRNNLRAVASAYPKKTDSVMHKWAQATRAALKSYGYPARSSSYVRTGRLASSWKAEKLKDGTWGITNNVAGPNGRFYARYVVGEKSGPKNQRQAWMHQDYWWRADEVIEKEHIPELTTLLTELFVELHNQ